jgi:hypothetical protein
MAVVELSAFRLRITGIFALLRYRGTFLTRQGLRRLKRRDSERAGLHSSSGFRSRNPREKAINPGA